MPVNRKWYETRGVLAGAYKNIESIANRLTHTILIQHNGGPTIGEAVLCKRVKVENLTDPCAYTEEELEARPTCSVCLTRDPRFHSEATDANK